MLNKSFIINIFGTGGFAKEVYSLCQRVNSLYKKMNKYTIANFVSTETGGQIYNIPIVSENEYDVNLSAVVAFGNPSVREKVVHKILSRNPNTYFPILIDPSSELLLPDSIEIGDGSIICAGSIITCDVKMGEFTNLNLNTTIGHDCVLGDYFTTAPLSSISGNVKTGKKVYFGAASSCKEHINIVDDVTIGMGSAVVKDINESGIYIGVPSIKK